MLGETKVVNLCISNRCGHRCIFCGDVRGKLTEPTGAQVKRRLDELRRRGYDGVDLSSKEFTLRKDALEIVKHARARGYRMIHLVTNGRAFADARTAALFLDNGVNKLTISLHSDRAETEQTITGDPAGLRDKVAAIGNVLRHLEAAKNPCLFSVNTVMTPLTAPRLDRVMAFVAGLGVRRHNLFFPKIQGHFKQAFDRLVPRFRDIAAPLTRGLDRGLAKGLVYSILDVPPCVVPKHAWAVCPRMKENVLETTAPKAARTRRVDVRETKAKGDPCRRCSASSSCEGVFRAYIDRRGWEEFVPLP